MRAKLTAPERFEHPSPRFDALVQIILMLTTAALLLVILAEIPLVLFEGFPLLFAVLIIVTCLGLIPFTLVPLVAAPDVEVSTEGVTVHPRFWREQFVPWSDIAAVKVYPLMPSEGSEVTRKLLVGRRKYRPMDGIMLVIPSLPLIFRIQGLLVGEGFTGVIAITNRSHAGYERLVKLMPKVEPLT